MITAIDSMPWLHTAWNQLISNLRNDRLPHALLVAGERGVGKRDYAEAVAALLVCDRLTSVIADSWPVPCGQCKQCELVAAGSHPDIRRYAPEKSRMIKVDQVRALSAFAVASPQVSHRKIVIVNRSDQLNINAANALLKTLEEPSDDVTLLLLQETGRPILPTLRSRCQTVTLPTPDFATGLTWLQQHIPEGDSGQGGAMDQEHLAQALRLAGLAPSLALEYLTGDFIQHRQTALEAFRRFMKNELSLPEAAKPFKTLGLDGSLLLMEKWAADLARLGVGADPADPEAADMLRYLARHNPPWRAHELLSSVRESRAAGINNVSPELEAERLLMQWQALMPRRRRRA